jgi:hypothetical protein
MISKKVRIITLKLQILAWLHSLLQTQEKNYMRNVGLLAMSLQRYYVVRDTQLNAIYSAWAPYSLILCQVDISLMEQINNKFFLEINNAIWLGFPNILETSLPPAKNYLCGCLM